MKRFLTPNVFYPFFCFFSCLIIGTSFSSCNKDTPEPLPEQPQPCTNCLPDITTTGKGTFGCKVNGALWLPKGGGGIPGTNMYYFNAGLTISGYIYAKEEHVSLSLSPITDTGYYQFGKLQNISSRVTLIPQTTDKMFVAQPATVGFLHLLRFDMDKGIVSGTFAFDAYNAQGDTVHITDGRFDLHF